MHYLDNAATTAPAPEVAAVVNEALLHHWGNPSSLYGAGVQAEVLMAEARGVMAKALGCKPGDVVFTAGGTEANNLAILGAAAARQSWANHLVATGYEHPSVQGPLRQLAARAGFELTEVPPGKDGTVDMEALLAAVGPKTGLLCAMQVNNETGAVLDVAMLAAEAKRKNSRCFVHVDGVQGFCKLPGGPGGTQVDSYALSGHKLHAPKGVGALYLKAKSNLVPPLLGGGQEHGLRPGTENTAYIAGLAKATQLAMAGQKQALAHMATLRARLLEGLERLQDITLHAPPGGYVGTLMFSLPKGLRSQVMLNHLDAGYGVCVSSGSACSGGSASHTLQAMGLPAHLIDSALRVSFCAQNTAKDVDALLEGLADGIGRLARA